MTKKRQPTEYEIRRKETLKYVQADLPVPRKKAKQLASEYEYPESSAPRQTIYGTWRKSKRSYARASRDLDKYHKTHSKTDLRYYNKHRKQAYRDAQRLSAILKKPVNKKNIDRIGSDPKIKRSRKQRKFMRTKFKRMIKYEDKDGKTRKKVVTYRFRNQKAMDKFTALLLTGQIPVGAEEDNEIMLNAEDDWEMRRLIAMFTGES